MRIARRAFGGAVLAAVLGGTSALATDVLPFAIGETTTLAFRFLNLSVAQATARLVADSPADGRPTVRLLVEARTGHLTSLFYPLRNTYDIRLDAATLLPLAVTKRIDERNFRTTLEATFPPHRKPGQPVYDFFSALLVVRRWALGAGDTLSLLLDADGDRWRALARRGAVDTLNTVRGKELARRVGVTFERLMLEPRHKSDFPDILSRELLSERGGLELWFPCASTELVLRAQLARPGLWVGCEWIGD